MGDPRVMFLRVATWWGSASACRAGHNVDESFASEGELGRHLELRDVCISNKLGALASHLVRLGEVMGWNEPPPRASGHLSRESMA